MTEWRDYIDRRDDTAVGKPVLKGTRFAVSIVMEYMASGMGFEEFLRQFPHVTREQLVAAHLFAAEVLENIKSDEAMPPKVKPPEFWEGPEWQDVGDYLRVRALSTPPEDDPSLEQERDEASLAGR